MKGHGRAPLLSRDAARVDEGGRPVVDADSELHRHRHCAALAHRGPDDGTVEAALPRQGRAPAVAGDLSRRAAEVEVDVVDAEPVEPAVHQQPDRLSDGARVGSVELD